MYIYTKLVSFERGKSNFGMPHRKIYTPKLSLDFSFSIHSIHYPFKDFFGHTVCFFILFIKLFITIQTSPGKIKSNLKASSFSSISTFLYN